MIRFVDGFDLCDFSVGSPLKYPGYQVTFSQGRMIAGRDNVGRAIAIENSAFGEVFYETILDSQPVWGFHMDFQWEQAPFVAMQWYRIGGLAGTAFALNLRTYGKMDLIGPLGSVLATTSAPFAVGTFSTLELKVQFSHTGRVELRNNGVTVAAVNVDFGTFADNPLPDRMGFHYQAFAKQGLVIDNYVVWDGQVVAGDPFHDFYGRVQVQTLRASLDATSGWTPKTGNSDVAMVFDSSPSPSPDGDTTYIAPTGTGTDALLDMAAPDCVGLIIALAFNVCAKPTAPSNPTIDLVCQLNGPTQVVGNVSPQPVGNLNPFNPVSMVDYLTYQVIVLNSPATGAVWNSQEIADGSFGVGASANTDVRVTAFYLEQVIDLTGRAFDCGGGPRFI